jgi:predicted ATP-grasp superfamily ATP-dependent carboligase
MEKLLIAGVNTRPLAKSAYELGYEVYSASYFCTSDFNSYHHKKCILKQKPHHSCGYFQESYRPSELRELCSEWIDEIDYIIPYTGISPQNFPSSKVLGNKNVENIENKYQLYKKIRKHFNLPETFLLTSLEEAGEINNQNPEKEYLIKPVHGSGGYGIFQLDSLTTDTILNNSSQAHDGDNGYDNGDNSNYCLKSISNEKFILQEYISGSEVSSSVISTKKEALSIISSSQLINPDESSGNKFIYSGNITPYPGKDMEIKEIGQEVIEHLKLIGSNGVDMIINNEEIYVIEVNPRFQGTFECAESSLGINLIEAHIKSCSGELIEIPEVEKYSVKEIIYAPEKSIAGKLNIPGVYDIPQEQAIIEKGEPLVTILQTGKSCADAINKTNYLRNKVKENIYPVKNI